MNRLTIEELEFAEYLASKLWEMSSLRHALFTPDQFQKICADTIKQAMHDKKNRPTPEG